jgi:hypothetical protein
VADIPFSSDLSVSDLAKLMKAHQDRPANIRSKKDRIAFLIKNPVHFEWNDLDKLELLDHEEVIHRLVLNERMRVESVCC